MDEQEQFFAAATCPSVEAAYLVAGRLADEGLDATVEPFDAVETMGLSRTGGVRVLVPASQRAAAEEILAALEAERVRVVATESAADEEDTAVDNDEAAASAAEAEADDELAKSSDATMAADRPEEQAYGAVLLAVGLFVLLVVGLLFLAHTAFGRRFFP